MICLKGIGIFCTQLRDVYFIEVDIYMCALYVHIQLTLLHAINKTLQ